MGAEPSRVQLYQPQMFLDDSYLEDGASARRHWHALTKHPANPLLQQSGAEWELLLFGSVLREPDPLTGEPMFRMWYYVWGELRDDKKTPPWIAYACSRDGINWRKPELGILEIDGNTRNNAVSGGGDAGRGGMSGVIRDPLGTGPHRYRMMFEGKVLQTQEKRYFLGSSPDGLHWTPSDSFVPTRPAYPDRSCLVWDPWRREYCLYSRSRHRVEELVSRSSDNYFGRAVALMTSRDLSTWSDPVLVMHPDAADPPGTEIYGGSFFPHAGLWMGLPQIHCSLPSEAAIDIAFAHSRDGRTWTRENHTVLPLGDVGEWDRFNQCVATAPVAVGDEWWIYYSGRTYRHGEYVLSGLRDTGPRVSSIGLASIRIDGWCSMAASFDGGTVTTKPILLPADATRMLLNASSRWGAIIVEVLDESGAAVAESRPLTGDNVRMEAVWPNGSFARLPRQRPYRFRFRIVNARIYSWSVVPDAI